MSFDRFARFSVAPILALGLGVALAAAGCGNSQLVCDPECPAGFQCTEQGCVATNPIGVDLAGVSPADFAGCSTPCGGATPYCKDGKCVPCLTDDNCPAGNICKVVGNTTTCLPGCSDDKRCGGGSMRCCGGGCLDTSKDTSNCGACGNSCGSQNSRSTCVAGVCMPGACNAGWGDCNGDTKDGCETNLRVDVKNCAACNTACKYANAVPGCADGCYLAACLFGYDDCNGDEKDGCETSVLSDAKNCGACGSTCAARPNAQVKCINAGCQLTQCNPGYADCNANSMDGCEVTVATDAKNCGTCGNACPQGQVCINGGCTCGNCQNVFPNAKTKCVNAQCVFDGCAAGYGDCDNNQNNGCEVNLQQDAKNCNACGNACPQNQLCSFGVCSVCGNDCWGATGCVTAMGRCIQFTCRAGNSGANFCNACKGWKEVTYDQWMNQGYCSDVIARYRMSDGTATHCGNAAACCANAMACGGGDNAWHFWDTNGKQNYYTGPCLGCNGDTNCKYWNNVDNSGYTRITVCER